MIQIRNGTFETNSSSVHSICIAKEMPVRIPKTVRFGFGEFGWEEDEAYRIDYFWTAICELNDITGWDDNYDHIITDKEKYNELKKWVTDTLREYGVEYVEFDDEIPEYFGIDHCDELEPFIEHCKNDTDFLIRFLFGDSRVYTGNDNDGYDMEIPDHYCDKNKYEYYIKEN